MKVEVRMVVQQQPDDSFHMLGVGWMLVGRGAVRKTRDESTGVTQEQQAAGSSLYMSVYIHGLALLGGV